MKQKPIHMLPDLCFMPASLGTQPKKMMTRCGHSNSPSSKNKTKGLFWLTVVCAIVLLATETGTRDE